MVAEYRDGCYYAPGHSDLTILRRYLALVQEDLEEAHRKHGAVDNML